MRRHLPLLLFLSIAFASAGSAPQSDDAEIGRYVKNEAFGFGEHLEYRVGYKFITAGTASFDIQPKPVMKNGRPCYDIRFVVRSLESLDWLYLVRDEYRTVMDAAGLFPWEFNQRLREGGYRRDFSAILDQVNHVARTTDGDFPITPYIHDVVSALYYVRTQNLRSFKNGGVLPLRNFFNKDCHDLGVRILGRQTVDVSAGTFSCIVVEPLVKEGGLFKSDGRILIWLTDDDRKVPVKVSSKIPIGSIDAELTGYSGLRGPLTSKKGN
ncbi:MAG: DUF3108 domain-containing protein [Candidatus Kapaibacterium sp.]